MNKSKQVVCCVICLNEVGEILLIKREREPYKNKWSLISGVGYLKHGLTPEQGVHAEVVCDVLAVPSDVEYLFTLSHSEGNTKVFGAYIESIKVTPQSPYVTEVAWCSRGDVESFGKLAFEHSDILDKFFKK